MRNSFLCSLHSIQSTSLTFVLASMLILIKVAFDEDVCLIIVVAMSQIFVRIDTVPYQLLHTPPLILGNDHHQSLSPIITPSSSYFVAHIRNIPPSDKGGLHGIIVIECNFDSFANVVNTSDAIQLLRSIHLHALQYSMDMLMLSSLLLLSLISGDVYIFRWIG